MVEASVITGLLVEPNVPNGSMEEIVEMNEEFDQVNGRIDQVESNIRKIVEVLFVKILSSIEKK